MEWYGGPVNWQYDRLSLLIYVDLMSAGTEYTLQRADSSLLNLPWKLFFTSITLISLDCTLLTIFIGVTTILPLFQPFLLFPRM